MLNSNRRLLEKTVVLSDSERRSAPRFPIQLKIQYRLSGRCVDRGRTGLTVNISSAGMLIKTQCGGRSRGASWPVANERVEVVLYWPFLSSGTTVLEFIAEGRVIRCDTMTFAASFERYQFRTAGSVRQDLVS